MTFWKIPLLGRILALGALLLALPAAQAAVVYATRAAFEATLTSSFTDDYEAAGYQSGDVQNLFNLHIHSNAQMNSIVGQTRYTPTGFPNRNLIDLANPAANGLDRNFYCAGCNGSFVLDFTATSFGDSSGVRGVGFDYLNFDIPAYVAFVTFGDDTTENISIPSASALAPGFFGITSPLSIKSIALGLPDGGIYRSTSFAIDNLTIGAGGPLKVPEPGTWALVGTALAALAWRRRTSPHGAPGH